MNFLNKEINAAIAILIIAVISGIFGSIIWYYGSQGIDSALVLKTNVQSNFNNQMRQAELQPWRDYENTDYKFSLVFPKDWEGYKTTDRTFDWGTIGKSDSLDFGFDNQSNVIFNIAFVQKKQFKQLQNSGEPYGTYLGENSDVAFVLNQAKYSNDEKTAKLLSEIPDIIKSFKTEK